jgi:hypothetical protein
MDPHNRFHTRASFRWARIESLVLMTLLIALALWHVREVDLLRFALAFAAIDVLGYIPGAMAYRRAGGRRIPAIYHTLYNVTHSYTTAAVVIGVWWWLAGGLEWAMLALPIHLAGDRGVFGNVYKPRELPFEPRATPTSDALEALEGR